MGREAGIDKAAFTSTREGKHREERVWATRLIVWRNLVRTSWRAAWRPEHASSSYHQRLRVLVSSWILWSVFSCAVLPSGA